MVSVDVKHHVYLLSRQWHRADHLCQDEGNNPNYPHLFQSPGLVGINMYLNQSCVKVDVGVLGSLSLISRTVSVDYVKHHVYLLTRKLTANEQGFFRWCSNSSKLVTNNSDYISRLFYNCPCCLRRLR